MTSIRFLLLTIIFLSIVPPTTAIESLPTKVDNILQQLIGNNEEEEILDPEQAFIISVDAIAEDSVYVHWEIAEGYYLYKDKFSFSFPNEKIEITDLKLSEGKRKHDPIFGDVWVNYAAVEAWLTLQVPQAGWSSAELLVQYQGCKEDTLCYPPISKTLPVQFTVADNLQTSSTEGIETGAMPVDKRQSSEQQVIASDLSNKGLLGNLLAFFGFGLLLSLTPCVFPMVPILLGIIARQSRNMTSLRTFSMPLIYVLTVACTYAVLGVIAGLFNLNLQAAAQNIWIIIAFSALFVWLALAMFGFYELSIPIPERWRSRLFDSDSQQGSSIKGVIGMAVLSAIIVGPCVTPPLVGALLYISQTGDAVFGGLSLFALGLGMGVPLLLLGISAGKLLPRVGAWMQSIQHFFGVCMLGTAIWFMGRILPGSVELGLWSLLFIGTSVYMGVLDSPAKQSWQKKLSRGLGLAMLIYGIIVMVGAVTGGDGVLRPLQGLSKQSQGGAVYGLPFQTIKGIDGLQSALAEATRNDKKVMLDFYADWCVTCKEMEHGAFSDPVVQQTLRGVTLLRADVTDHDLLDRALLKEFNLYGPPAILFFNQAGAEERSYRVVGFMDIETFLAHVQQAING